MQRLVHSACTIGLFAVLGFATPLSAAAADDVGIGWPRVSETEPSGGIGWPHGTQGQVATGGIVWPAPAWSDDR